MEYNVIELLSPRIQEHCLPLWSDGYFMRDAVEQVRLRRGGGRSGWLSRAPSLKPCPERPLEAGVQPSGPFSQ